MSTNRGGRRIQHRVAKWTALWLLLTTGHLLAITGGEPDAENNFPNVGALVALEIPGSFAGLGLTPPQSFSSGTLIHPRVLLTAGHSVGFLHFLMDVAIPPNNTARPDSFADIGVVILAEPVLDIELVQLPEPDVLGGPGAQSALQIASANDELVVVGYGAIDPPRPSNGFAAPSGLRSHTPIQFRALRSDYLLGFQNFAQAMAGAENGDSGGPLFWETDGQRVQIGIVSGGDPVSASLGIYQRTDTPEAREFIETILALVELGAW